LEGGDNHNSDSELWHASKSAVWFDVASHSAVIAGHSRSKNGVASLAYDPAIQLFFRRRWIAGSSPAMTAEVSDQHRCEPVTVASGLARQSA
jgi:hypothetical protein